MIRLLCVEDDPLVATYLQTRLSLEPDIEVAGVVSNAGEALVFLREQAVNVVLLDYQLDGADGMQLLSAIAAPGKLHPGAPAPRVLFCTALTRERFSEEASALGAAGLVMKDQMSQELIPAVRAVAGGGCWFPAPRRSGY